MLLPLGPLVETMVQIELSVSTNESAAAAEVASVHEAFCQRFTEYQVIPEHQFQISLGPGFGQFSAASSSASERRIYRRGNTALIVQLASPWCRLSWLGDYQGWQPMRTSIQDELRHLEYQTGVKPARGASFHYINHLRGELVQHSLKDVLKPSHFIAESVVEAQHEVQSQVMYHLKDAGIHMRVELVTQNMNPFREKTINYSIAAICEPKSLLGEKDTLAKLDSLHERASRAFFASITESATRLWSTAR